MSFLAPMLLLGGAAVSVPVALHFFYKARYRPVPWAAMEFLRQSIEQTSRRLRFQELILLLLRCAVLLLLALALARPTFNALTAGGRGESIDAVLVFDTSFSMGARDGEATRFERAKAAATAVIDNLPANSTVQVVTCADRAANVGPVTPGNLDQAKQLVQSLALSSQAGDMLPGLAEAYTAMDRMHGTNKEVYLFTDLQKTGWDRQAGAVRAKAAEIKGRATVVVVRCGEPARPVGNVSVADLTFPGGIPHSGTRLPVTVLLRNAGKEPVKNLTVTLEVDGKPQETESGSVDEVGAGQTFPVTLTAKLDRAGPVLLTARVQPDDLPGDNRLDKVIAVRDRLRVLVVDGNPDVRDPKQAGSHFLVNAMLPVAESQRDDYFVKVTVVPPEEAGPALLGVADVCVLCDVPATTDDRPGAAGLTREFADRLLRFVRDGGGLIVGSGDHVVAQRYNTVLGTAGLGLLPFDLDDAVSTPPERPFTPAPESAEAPGFLARFRDEPFATVTRDAEVFKVMGVRDGEATGGRVLLRLADGKPMLAARVVGEGEVIFAATSLDTAWGNWPAKGGSYVSFVRFALAHLTGKGARGTNLVAGQPVVYLPPEAVRGFDVVRPDGTRVRLGKARGGDAGGKLAVTYPGTDVAGVYRVGPEGEEPPTGPRYAVAPDLRETDNLDPLADAEIEPLMGFRPVVVQAGADADTTLANERSRREWTVWVLLLVFAAAVAEMAFAWVCGRAW